jgi:uncharacterized protein YkwD
MRVLALGLILAMTVSGAVYAVTAWQTGTVSKAATAELRALIGAEHFRVCSRSLAHDPQLRWVARWKAMDMGLRDDLDHRTVDGHEIWDFYDRAGIPKPYGAGEIIGVNTFPVGVTAQVVFDGWMASAGHRALIRNCDYDRFGVGAFRTRDLKWYAVEFTNVTR